MRVDISQIIHKNGASMPFELSYTIENVEDYPDVVDFLTPVKMKGSITSAEGVYVVDGIVDTKVRMKCSRCLIPVEVAIHFKLDEMFSNTGMNKEEEIETFSGDVIDFTAVVQKNILFCLPMKVLCREDCKGLCPVCGKDLNDGDCGCDTTEIDPRFESLRSLFKLDEEV